MTQPKDNQANPPHLAAQVAATWAALDAAHRGEELTSALTSQDRALLSALREMQVVRDFVGTPESILGSPTTKHGEIAEQVHVGFRRALDALHGRIPTATFDGIGRFDPIDYRDAGLDIQSKYYNGLRNTLDGISEHAARYPGFAAGEGRYHIPRDQYQQLAQVNQNGQIEGLSDRSANAIRDRVNSLEQYTNRSGDDLIQPGEATYREVQQGRVHQTLRERENTLAGRSEELKDAARAEHSASLAGLGQAAAIGAAVGAGVGLAQGVWVKYREGKNPFRGEFSAQDWQDLGVPVVQGAGGGAVAGGSLYLLTNSTNLSAPAAGAFVSGLMGIGSLLHQYHSGSIDGREFVDLSQIVAMDAAIVGMASMAGQVAIPVPLLGAFIGSLAGKLVASAIGTSLVDSESELMEQLDCYERSALEQLDRAYETYVHQLEAYFGNLERLARVAFDDTVNTDLRLGASVGFAETVGVPDERILRTSGDLDRFIQE